MDQANVALFAYYYLPDNTSGVQRASRLARYLPECGFPTCVIASSHAGIGADGAGNVVHVPGSGPPEKAARWSRIADRVERFLPYREKLPWVPHAVAAFEERHGRSPFAAVISTSPPTGSHIAAWWIKKHYGIPWIADFRDPILGNPGRPRQWARPYDRALERKIFRDADVVLSVTDTTRDQWRAQYPRWAGKFEVVWNGFDPGEGFGPRSIPQRPYRVLMHAGVLYSLRHPYPVMASLERLTATGKLDSSRFRVRFVGTVQEAEAFRASPEVAPLAARGCLEMDNVLVPREQAMEEIATADYLFLIDIVNADKVGYTVPAKLYDYLLTGRPILTMTDPGSPVDRILASSGVPYVCVYRDDSGAVVDGKLERFFQFSSEPSPPSAWFVENFDGRRQAAAIGGIIRRLCR